MLRTPKAIRQTKEEESYGVLIDSNKDGRYGLTYQEAIEAENYVRTLTDYPLTVEINPIKGTSMYMVYAY
jgi:hypothetical protein